MSDSEYPSDGAIDSGPPIQRSSQFDAVFEQFKGYVDSRLHDLATASATNIESSKSLSETKKLRREAEASKLKKKGNLKQFLFNAEILDEVKSITEDLHTQDTASANKAAKGAFVWDIPEQEYIPEWKSRHSGMRIAPKQTLICIIPIILIPD